MGETVEHGFAENEEESDEYRITRNATGHVIKLEHWHQHVRHHDRRYNTVIRVETVWTWRPRLKLYEMRTDADNLYRGKAPVIRRARIADISKDIAEAERVIAGSKRAAEARAG